MTDIFICFLFRHSRTILLSPAVNKLISKDTIANVLNRFQLLLNRHHKLLVGYTFLKPNVGFFVDVYSFKFKLAIFL